MVTYHRVIRPWHIDWGTIGDEATRLLPGDGFAATQDRPSTHAITIRGPARDVWPWIIQIGQRRGGFYSYTWLENLFGCRMMNADRIVPEWQHREIGDEVWLHPKGPPLKVIELEEGHALVLGGRSGSVENAGTAENSSGAVFSWAFVLDQQTETETRFIVRGKGHWGTGWKWRLFDYLIGEPAHFIMERRMLLGIKRRVESGSSTDDEEHGRHNDVVDSENPSTSSRLPDSGK